MTTCSKCSECSQGHPRRQIKRQSSGGKGSRRENRGQSSGLADAAAAEVEEADCLTQTETQAPRVTTDAICVILCRLLLLPPHFCGAHRTHQRSFLHGVLGEPLSLNPARSTAYLKHAMTSVH